MRFLYQGVALLTDMGNLSPVMQETLIDLHEHGDNVPANIGDNIGRHSNSVSRALRRMVDDYDPPLVRNKQGRGVWTLTDRGLDLAERLRTVQDVARDDDNDSSS